MARRPRPIVHGSLRTSVVRGPRPDGRWYWRTRDRRAGAHVTVWTGWATPAEVDREVGAILAGTPRAARPEDRCDTVRDLAELWIGSRETDPSHPRRSVDTWRAT